MKTKKTLLWAALPVVCALALSCGGKAAGAAETGTAETGAPGPAAVNLDGKWSWAGPREEYYDLIIEGTTYTRTASVVSMGPYYSLYETGTFARTETEWTYFPVIRGEFEEYAEPLSEEQQELFRETVSYSLSGGTLEVGGQSYRLPYTGPGASYTGVMARDGTNLDIRVTLGGFKNGDVVNSFYVYTRRNTPIKLNGSLTGTLLELREDGGTFWFKDFDPQADAVTGSWAGGKTVYEVTLVKDREGGE